MVGAVRSQHEADNGTALAVSRPRTSFSLLSVSVCQSVSVSQSNCSIFSISGDQVTMAPAYLCLPCSTKYTQTLNKISEAVYLRNVLVSAMQNGPDMGRKVHQNAPFSKLP